MRNSAIGCSCNKFERLEGAAVNAYTTDYLKSTSSDKAKGVSYYQCRICLRHWKRIDDEKRNRPVLIRLENQVNV